jgi:hypothetical protein
LDHASKPLAANGFQAIPFLAPDFLGKTNEWDAPLGEVQESLMDVSQVRFLEIASCAILRADG